MRILRLTTGLTSIRFGTEKYQSHELVAAAQKRREDAPQKLPQSEQQSLMNFARSALGVVAAATVFASLFVKILAQRLRNDRRGLD
jgi:hypothetical protein